jgi:hypothetical protein
MREAALTEFLFCIVMPDRLHIQVASTWAAIVHDTNKRSSNERRGEERRGEERQDVTMERGFSSLRMGER